MTNGYYLHFKAREMSGVLAPVAEFLKHTYSAKPMYENSFLITGEYAAKIKSFEDLINSIVDKFPELYLSKELSLICCETPMCLELEAIDEE